MRRNAKRFRSRQGGFSIMELVIVVAVMLVLLSITMNWVMGMAKESRRAQESDLLAKELNLISKATKEYLTTAPAATYPLNTSVPITIPTLITAGLLPTDFAARMGTGTAAVSPFGQPYSVVARRITAGVVPTAVVSEMNIPMPVKLAKVGVEDTDPTILAFKQNVAAQSGQSYKTIAASINKGTRLATGVGNSFTKDLSAYFTADFLASSAVALVNFPDLEPGGGSPPGGGLPEAPTYSTCRIVQGVIGGAGTTIFNSVCRSPRLLVADEHVDVCSNGFNIAVLPFGGTLTTGVKFTGPEAASTNQSDCLHDWAGSACGHIPFRRYGSITMNSATIDSKLCENGYYSGGNWHDVLTQVPEYDVCCFVDPLPSP